MEHPAISAWLDEIEVFGVRRERVPEGAMPWIVEAFMRGQEAEREACAVLAETFFDGKTDNISCHQANGADKIAKAIRNRT